MTPALTDTPAVDRVDAVATAPDVFHAMASFQQAAAAHLDARRPGPGPGVTDQRLRVLRGPARPRGA
ncbi:hypothetical protein [Streptomyces sp. NPDC002573]|uniref:hypothetical protein n=1 Tax=Streptomyces sp. NPDC002573 TaxID=3364651 RepID=UPI0036954ED0